MQTEVTDMAVKKEMDQDRRDAMHWAEEWKIRRRNRRIITAVIALAAVIAIGYLIDYISVLGARTVYSSEEEMKQALQGRFATDYAEDIVIDGDTVTLTYYNQSHYDLEFAERFGYSEYDDAVYEDEIVKWDYRKGRIECKWMAEITVDKEGRLRYYSQTYTRTDEPKPVPIDPSELSLYKKGYSDSEAARSGEEVSEEDEEAEPDADADMTDEEQAAQEAAQESQTETEAAAAEAGIEELTESGDDV